MPAEEGLHLTAAPGHPVDENSDTQALPNTNKEKGLIERMKPECGANGADFLKAPKLRELMEFVGWPWCSCVVLHV